MTAQKRNKTYSLFDNILVFITNDLPDNINIQNVLDFIEKRVPKEHTREIDVIYIGEFEEFYQRDINAFYKERAIYMTNAQASEEDLIDDLIHEIGHASEEAFTEFIYNDKELEKEFLAKRYSFYMFLKNNLNMFHGDQYLPAFLNPEYTEPFDRFLYQTLGYDKLFQWTVNLFLTPYSITCLRDYFAVGFEYFYMKGIKDLKQLSPILYKKLKLLDDELV